METPNRIAPRPPVLLEALVGWLTASVCPEVAGDLAERYSGVSAYLKQALEALPALVAHRAGRFPRRPGPARQIARVLGLAWIFAGMGVVALGGLRGPAAVVSGLAFAPLLAAGYRGRLTLGLGVLPSGADPDAGWCRASRRGVDIVALASVVTAWAPGGDVPAGVTLALYLTWRILLETLLDGWNGRVGAG
jgi:hypothetical protein